MYEFIILICLLTIGYIFGQAAEKKHFKEIQKQERRLRNILTFSERIPPPSSTPQDTQLVVGNVVISVDYFKSFVAGLRMLVGGRLNSYESLLERSRREAIIRMKRQAKDLGASSIFNVKIETASISGDAANGIGSIEVYVYGTAMIPRDS